MKIAYCGPISLSLIAPQFNDEYELLDGYAYPFGAYYVKELLRRGHEVVVVTSAMRAKETLRSKLGSLEVIVCPRRRPQKFIVDAYAHERRAMVDELRQSQPDIIHAQWCYEFCHAARSTGLPYVVTLRDAPWSVLWHFRSFYRLYRLVYSYYTLGRVKHMTAVSDYISDTFSRYYGKKEIRIVPNALDASLLVDQCREVPVGRGYRFLSVSGWSRLKNCKALLEAFKQVRETHHNAQLSLIGFGLEDGGEGHQWAKSRGLAEGVNFCGRMPHGEILGLLENETDIFAYTSLNESFCMVVLEAMAKGVPVVVFPKSGAVPWLVDYGKCGMIADCQKPEAFAESCLELMADPVLYQKLGAAAQARVKKWFTMEQVANAYLSIYDSVIREDVV